VIVEQVKAPVYLKLANTAKRLRELDMSNEAIAQDSA
jgi:hypothetical protein